MVFASCCVLRSGAEILEQTRKILMYEKAVSIKSPSVITGKDITSLGVVVMGNRPMNGLQHSQRIATYFSEGSLLRGDVTVTDE